MTVLLLATEKCKNWLSLNTAVANACMLITRQLSHQACSSEVFTKIRKLPKIVVRHFSTNSHYRKPEMLRFTATYSEQRSQQFTCIHSKENLVILNWHTRKYNFCRMNTAFAHALTATNLSTVTIFSGKSINRVIIYIPAFKKTASSSSRSLLLIHWWWLHWWPLLIVAPLLRWISCRHHHKKSNQCNIPAYALPPLWQPPTAIDLTYFIRITFCPPFWIPSGGQISILESKVPSPRKKNLKNPSLVTGALKLKQHRKADLMKKKKQEISSDFPGAPIWNNIRRIT